MAVFQVERLQEELAAEYLRYRDECDARKLLVTDLNELRAQQEEAAAADSEDEAEQEDPLTLKIALRSVRSWICWGFETLALTQCARVRLRVQSSCVTTWNLRSRNLEIKTRLCLAGKLETTRHQRVGVSTRSSPTTETWCRAVTGRP